MAPPQHLHTSSPTPSSASSAANAAAAAAAGQRMTVLLCVVTKGRPEACVSCAVSLLRLQGALMGFPDRVHVDMHFVNTTDDAFNLLHAHKEATGVVIVDASLGFDAEFPLRALKSELPVVVASYPLPTINWDRVKQQPSNEEPRFWGNEYSIKPSGRAGPNGYVHVTDAKLGVAWVTKAVVTDIVKRHPEIAASDGTASFAQAGVYDGTRLSEDQRFLALYGGDVWADVEHPASSTGPIEFGGCVGVRRVLR